MTDTIPTIRLPDCIKKAALAAEYWQQDDRLGVADLIDQTLKDAGTGLYTLVVEQPPAVVVYVADKPITIEDLRVVGGNQAIRWVVILNPTVEEYQVYCHTVEGNALPIALVGSLTEAVVMISSP